ncbi:hypothetical protein [Photobacterium galatheae]|uniref:Uncharacterized protein n=1 Tax=Photobacterium galatheae TaxID=1654360 RepID=A0A066RPH0_9GAMM|nr:hypothetical protein [Photobacterium galatheae]KDM91016.1 hypothetical protein EA58_14795 [Photobacterium galatheae]MCM0149032.1 hypothetical protein [Photobacterium galatheae]
MFVKIRNRLIKKVEFDSSDIWIFEYQSKIFNTIEDLFEFMNDEAVCIGVLEILLRYLNRNQSGNEVVFSIENLKLSDGYDVQWGLDRVEKEMGIKIDYYGAVVVKEFLGFSKEAEENTIDEGESIRIPF